MNKVTIKNYQTKAPFTSFLPGISGWFGKPLWTFYINRGQLMVSFGVRDKNGAIMEFYPANTAYMYEHTNGFKTFIKIDDKFYSFFSKPNDNQLMHIYKDRVSIEETNHILNLKVTITYFTLPNEPISALSRHVKIENLSSKPRNIELLDGLSQMLPSGIDYGAYKAISNLLQSWMDVHFDNGFAFYKLRASTDDSTVVKEVTDGNFFLSKINGYNAKLVADTKRVFTYDTSFQTPHGFIEGLELDDQVTINQVPCAYAYYKGKIDKTLEIESLFGYVDNIDVLRKLKLEENYLTHKQKENEKLVESVLNELEVSTALKEYDAYMKQCLLDNILRGGKPISFETLDGKVSYHLYSRKHGDPERDYNFFTIEPMYFSQGNGNFRDVLQNRRNDNFFYKDLESFNIKHFFSLIQADGYNPLSIEGVKFKYKGEPISKLTEVLNRNFTPGELAQQLAIQGLTEEEVTKELKSILKHSHIQIEANYGEGYWQDHFTYLYDLIDNYLKIYPDKEEELLFNEMNYMFFNSPIEVKPRDEKSYLVNGKVRQYDALRHIESKDKWLMIDSKPIKVSLSSKILTLILNKYGLLDAESIGILYEAERPGWNDALNGLPSLFGSGVSEMIELLRLTIYFKQALDKYNPKEIVVINQIDSLMDDLFKANTFEDRIKSVEIYRTKLKDFKLIEVSGDKVKRIISKILITLEEAYQKAQQLDSVIPTYLTYKVSEYKLLNKKGFHGFDLVLPTKYETEPIASFLEGPARSLKVSSPKEAKNIYQAVKKTELYDSLLKCYKTSVSLDHYTNELGRIRAFTKGWLERESNFLHMTYKYLYGLLKAGLYDEYFLEMFNNYTCFMDIETYKRNPLENSSFIATSNNQDPKNHGRGFVSRLSGSTAEALSMYTTMFFGKHPFKYDKTLMMEFKPILHEKLFLNNKVTCYFYNTKITYVNLTGSHIYEVEPSYIEVIEKGILTKLDTNYLPEEMALNVRKGNVLEIDVYFN